jgi:hypothetical protein
MEKLKNHLRVFLTISAGMVLIGAVITSCNPTPTTEDNQTMAKDSIAKIDTTNTINTKDMDTYKEKMNDTLASIDRKIDEYKVKLKKDGKELKEDYKKAMADLDQRGKELKKKLDEYSDKGKDKWEEFKKGFNRDMDTLSKQFKNLTSSDKTKP